jgi:hypothetical protein
LPFPFNQFDKAIKNPSLLFVIDILGHGFTDINGKS